MKSFGTVKACLVGLLILSIFMILQGCSNSNGAIGGGHWNQPVRLVVTPVTATIPVSGIQQYTATAIYSDGAAIDRTAVSTWTSGSPGVATIGSNTGLATGVAPGTSVITATYAGMTANATLNVNAATFLSFVVRPAAASIPVSGTQQFTAIETFSDGSSFDRTAVSAWTSPDLSGGPGVATIGANTGLATGVKPGQSTITAVYNGRTATAVLTVNAATFVSFVVRPATASIPVSGTQQFAAIEIFSDGTSFDRTAVSAWTSPDLSGGPGVATIGANTGLATGVAPGRSTITAVYNGRTATAVLTVNAATSVSFVVKPSAATIPVSGTQQFAAIETFSDGTSFDRTTVSAWTSPDLSGGPGVAIIGANTGRATGVALGQSTITAVYNGHTATAVLTVNAATFVSFVVKPATASIPVTGTQQFAAIETFSDGTSFDRSAVSAWTSPDLSGGPGVATIGPATGLATGVATGQSTITAVYNGHTATAVLTVNAATFVSFVVKPVLATMPVTSTQQYSAIETFSDGTSFDRTTVSAWTSPDFSGGPGVATMSPNGAGGGVATGVAPGVSTITAVYDGHTGTARLTVTAATVLSILVTPASATISIDAVQIFRAFATYGDGTSIEVTTDPGTTWNSASPLIATMSPNGAGGGVATGVAAGTSNITASFSGKTSPASILTVTIPPAPSCLGSGPVDMGAAASFAILVGPAGGATLSITNPTTVVGDVGAASITPASGPTTLVGNLYTGVDAPYVAAKAAMLTAIGCASARPCGVGAAFNFGAAHDFGGNILAPGVYCVTGGMSVGSDLTLSTPGVYIFRSTGALISANNITMAFGGTANATNTSVFWVPTGAASLGSGNKFLGTIMPDASAASTLGATTTLIGRVLSNSDVNLDTNIITKPTP